jgi:peptidyl-prolyl cis-trans isomerase B (cyclophilin B)
MTNPQYCARCGTLTVPGERFCGECGNDLTAQGSVTNAPLPPPGIPSTPPYQQQIYSTPPNSFSYPAQGYTQATVKKGNSLPLIIVLILILLVGGVGGYFLFFNKSVSSSPQAFSTTPTPIATSTAEIATPTIAPSATTAESLPTIALPSPTTNTQAQDTIPPIVATPMPRTTPSPGPVLIDVDKGIASKEMIVATQRGNIVIDLYPNAAPNTIAIYENMANSGQYDGNTFHRVEDWVLQGNDPLANGTGGGDIPTELNKIPFKIGSVGIARTSDITYSNDSQFFIVKDADPTKYPNFDFLNTVLDSNNIPTNGYTLIGQVTSGMGVVDAMQIGDKIISIRVRGKGGAAQTTPAGGGSPELAQLLVDAANRMKGMSSFHLEQSTQTGGKTYTLSGDVLTSGSSSFTYNDAGTTYYVITISNKQYYSADDGKTWLPSTTDLLANVKYYFNQVWSDISGLQAASLASSVHDLGSETVGNQATRHLSVDVATLYGKNTGGLTGSVEFWIAPDKTVRRLLATGSSGGSVVTVQFDWSSFNSPVNITAPTNIVTPTPVGGG